MAIQSALCNNGSPRYSADQENHILIHARMTRAGAARVLVLLALVVSLPGCTAHLVSQSARGWQNQRGCTDVSAPVPHRRWWRCLGDPQLSTLIERAPAHRRRSAEIARRYIALRAQQTALVLLAEREEIDGELLTAARECGADSAMPCPSLDAAAAQLLDTRVAQALVRAGIAAQREGLAALTGTVGVRYSLPGGPIPLPPPVPVAGVPVLADAHSALAQYDAARVAANLAQTAATDARAVAAAQTMRARAGTLPAGEALEADRRALLDLQAEEQARAEMTQAYLALLISSS